MRLENTPSRALKLYRIKGRCQQQAVSTHNPLNWQDAGKPYNLRGLSPIDLAAKKVYKFYTMLALAVFDPALS